MASKTVIGRIQLRRDTAANWTVKNPILASGELGYETDTRKGKVGDGNTTWNSLPYVWKTTVTTGSTNGTIAVDGTDVAVKGLGSAAYTASTAYAAASHSHNYAGSSSAGGAANSLVNFTAGLNGVAEHNANNIKSNGVWYYTSNGPATSLGATTNDGALYSQAYSTAWAGQIAQDYRNGNLFVRGLNNGTWTGWKKIACSPTSACTAGDYYAKNTVISLTVTLSNYSKLLFVCGTDSATEGVQTIEVPLNTGRTYHRLVWFTGDVATNYQWDGIARNAKALTVTINTSTNKVTIVASNVTSNGIRQIYAE